MQANNNQTMTVRPSFEYEESNQKQLSLQATIKTNLHSNGIEKGINLTSTEPVNPYDELRRTYDEVQPVKSLGARSDGVAVVEYRPTYRAELALRGYLVRETLGYGSYSKVKLGLDVKCMCNRIAVKIVDRNKAPCDYLDKFLPREIEIWRQLQHPHLVRLLDCFEDRTRVFMITDYAPCGDVLRHIQNHGALVEHVAHRWMNQLTSAVCYLHDLDIVHRDLKLENLLITAKGDLMVSDFGFVRKICASELSCTYCGSRSYASPEILMGKPYDPKKSDVWALAVVLYIFITGKMPFDESLGTKRVLAEQRQLAEHGRIIRQASAACHQLIMHMFTWDYPNRPSIYDVAKHSWILYGTTLYQPLVPNGASSNLNAGMNNAIHHHCDGEQAIVISDK